MLPFDWLRRRATRSRAAGVTDYPSLATVYATSALVSAASGQAERAHSDVKATSRLLSVLVDLSPWLECGSRSRWRGACLRLDDIPHARALLSEADSFLKRTPDAAILSEWLERTKAALEHHTERREGDWALTTAELRTLQYLLPSYLCISVRSASASTYSPSNTVKTQASDTRRGGGVDDDEAVAENLAARILAVAK